MNRKLNQRTVCTALFGSAALLALSAPAVAQQSGGVEEIVVTAERHSQNIMTVPSSIQAETGQQLNDAGIHNFTDLQFVTPGLLPSESAGYEQIYIRGVGNNIFVGADPSVATYIDDVPRIYGSMVNQFIDVNRVEVLKGAQGGLYGRNATGGVINIITRQPDTEQFDGTAQISYGEDNTLSAGAYVNVPLGDDLAWSIAAERDSHDPYIKNIAVRDPYSAADFTGNSVKFGTPAQQAATLNASVDPLSGLDNLNTYGADTKLLWQPASHFKVTLAGDYYFKDDTDGSQIVATDPKFEQATLQAVLGAFGFKPIVLPPGFVQSSGKFETALGDDQFVQLHDWGGSITAVWNSPIADVTDITAYRGQHTNYQSDLGGSSVPLIDAHVNNKKHFFYEEVRGVSTGDGPFHWLGGATFLNDNFTGNTVVGELFPATPAPVGHSYQLVQNYTVYGQAGYDITNALNFTTSLRWLQETNALRFSYPIVSGANTSEHALIPSATLSYALDDGTLYLRWARGFKAGGINPVADAAFFPSLSDGSVFGPEKVDTYEAGYKQSLMDRRLQLTGDIFYNKYNGLQVQDHADPAYAAKVTLAIVNVGSARTYGAEGSINYQVIDPLTIGANVGYLNAMYENFSLSNNPILVNFNRDGYGMINSPTWQVSFTVNLDQPINDEFRLVGNLVETHTSHVIFADSGLPGIEPPAIAPGYWLTNLRLGVRTTDDKYELAIFANNLFDAAYYTYGGSSTEGDIASWGNPRIVGGQFIVNF